MLNISIDDITDFIKQGEIAFLELDGIIIPLLKFADDIVLLTSSAIELQISLDLLTQYSVLNMLVINTEKSFVMHVRGRKRSTEQLNLHIAGKPLKQVAEFKYLGFYFNEQLSLNQSSDRIARNASSSFGNFRQKLSDLPNNCPFKIAEKMFHATVTSVGEYASEICGANPKLS